jgi:hypothetical protein
VVAIRREDAESFCQWLTVKNPGIWSYSLPKGEDLALAAGGARAWQSLDFFENDTQPSFVALSGEEILDRIRNDSDLIGQPESSPQASRAIGRLACFYLWCQCQLILEGDLARALDLALFVFDRDRDLDLARTLAGDLARSRYLDLAISLTRARVLAIDLALDRIAFLRKGPRSSVCTNPPKTDATGKIHFPSHGDGNSTANIEAKSSCALSRPGRRKACAMQHVWLFDGGVFTNCLRGP